MSDTFCDRVVGIKCMCFEDSNFRSMLSRALLTKKPEGKNAPGLPELILSTSNCFIVNEFEFGRLQRDGNVIL